MVAMDVDGEILYRRSMASSQGSDTPDGGSELIAPQANDRWPRGVACDGGFKLLGTPLGFRGSSRPGLLFYSDLDDPIPALGQRMLATPFAAAALGAVQRGFDVLILDYERTVRLGRMDIRLLSSGFGPGSAALEVSFRERRVLYCGAVRASSPLFGLPAEPTPCDLLLLDAAPAAPRGIAPRTAAHRLEAAVRGALAERRVASIACATRTAALEAAVVVSGLDTPFLAQRPIFEMLRRVERFGLAFLHMRRLEQTWPKEGVVLHYAHQPPPCSDDGVESRRVAVGPVFAGSRPPAGAIRMAEGEDRAGLAAFVRRTSAQNVAFGPRCDEQVAALIEAEGAIVYRLHEPTQIPLPI
jgi:hypothetical protein